MGTGGFAPLFKAVGRANATFVISCSAVLFFHRDKRSFAFLLSRGCRGSFLPIFLQRASPTALLCLALALRFAIVAASLRVSAYRVRVHALLCKDSERMPSLLKREKESLASALRKANSVTD